MDSPAFHTAGVHRLLDQYQQCVASRSRPDNDTAVDILCDIRNRVEQALQVITGDRPEREVYREALQRVIRDDDCDPVEVALEAITPYADWVPADAGTTARCRRAVARTPAGSAVEGAVPSND